MPSLLQASGVWAGQAGSVEASALRLERERRKQCRRGCGDDTARSMRYLQVPQSHVRGEGHTQEPLKPPSSRVAATTLWQGTTGACGLRRSACTSV